LILAATHLEELANPVLAVHPAAGGATEAQAAMPAVFALGNFLNGQLAGDVGWLALPGRRGSSRRPSW
jgi:uncharacterized protein (DUF697 family)